MKQTCLLFLLLVSLQLFAQEGRVKIYGEIKNNSIYIEGAHIINLNSKKGTVSNHQGLFNISVKENDTILFSDIQFENKMILIQKHHLENEFIKVNFQIGINHLDEIIIQNSTNISQKLGLPNSEKAPLNKNERNLNYYSQKSTPVVFLDALFLSPLLNALPIPYHLKPPKGGIDDIYNIISGNIKKHRKIKKLMDEDKLLEFNQMEIQKIRIHFKDDFFVNHLNISKEKIDSFIEFCLPRNIIEYFNNQRYIEIIDIFVKEVDNFNSILRQN